MPKKSPKQPDSPRWGKEHPLIRRLDKFEVAMLGKVGLVQTGIAVLATKVEGQHVTTAQVLVDHETRLRFEEKRGWRMAGAASAIAVAVGMATSFVGSLFKSVKIP